MGSGRRRRRPPPPVEAAPLVDEEDRFEAEEDGAYAYPKPMEEELPKGGYGNLDDLLNDPNFDPMAKRATMARSPVDARRRTLTPKKRITGIRPKNPPQGRQLRRTPPPTQPAKKRSPSANQTTDNKRQRQTQPAETPLPPSPPPTRTRRGRIIKMPRHLKDYDLSNINITHLDTAESLLQLEAVTSDLMDF